MVASAARRARRRWTASGAVAVLLVLCATMAAAVCAPVALASSSSWKSERTEQFSGSGLPKGCEKYAGKYTGGKSVWSARDVDVDGGQLKLRLERRKVESRNYASGGVGCYGWAQKYGKYEVRARIPKGAGIDSYLGLWPTSGSEGGWTGVEFLAPDVETAYITNGYGKKAETARVAGDYSGDYHVYTVEWAPKYLRITMDGDELFFSTKSFSGSRWFGLVVSNGDALTGLPDAKTKLPATFQIDRVREFSFTGIQPKLRSQSPAASRSRVEGKTTPVPTVAPTEAAKLPAATTAAPLPAVSTSSAAPALAGGIWPWLLGGSLIAAAAVALLNYPRSRASSGRGPPNRA